MPQAYCALCDGRIECNEKKLRLGMDCIWDKVVLYGISVKRTFQDSDKKEGKICSTCFGELSWSDTVSLKRKLRQRRGRDQALSKVNAPSSFFDNLETQDSFESNSAQISPESSPYLSHIDDNISESNSEVLDSNSSYSPSHNIISQSNFDSQISDANSNYANSSSATTDSSEGSSNETWELNIMSTISTASMCFICKGKENRVVVPKTAIVDVWIKRKIRVPFTNRVCRQHLQNGVLNEESLMMIQAIKAKTNFSATECVQFLNCLSDFSPVQKSVLTFDENSQVKEEDFKLLLGISQKHFEELHKYIKKSLRSSCNRSTRNALAIYLMKLRLNLSQQVLAILFGVHSQSRISETMERVRNALKTNFVPRYLGYSHKTREELLRMQPSSTRMILEEDGSSLILVIDGTYLYVQKPSDFELQKKTFSQHKLRNLVKEMMVVTPNGYIVKAEGLYYADGGNNDAKILNSMMKDEHGIKHLLQPNDHLILDRGFRDSVHLMQSYNIEVSMPQFLQDKEKQLTTNQANESRRVSMIRWVVESVNGRIKNVFKFFDSRIEASYLPVLGDDFNNACAISNAFFPALFTEKDEHMRFAEEALKRIDLENELQEFVERENLEKKRTCWNKADQHSFATFPKLTLIELKNITLGIYQLEMAEGYNFLHLSEDSGYDLFVHEEDSQLIRAKIESRFCKSTVHQLWIKYNANLPGETGIVAWYCKCKVGSRVVGCCAHVASVIRYLSFDRHNPNEPTRKRRLGNKILDAAAILKESEEC